MEKIIYKGNIIIEPLRYTFTFENINGYYPDSKATVGYKVSFEKDFEMAHIFLMDLNVSNSKTEEVKGIESFIWDILHGKITSFFTTFELLHKYGKKYDIAIVPKTLSIEKPDYSKLPEDTNYTMNENIQNIPEYNYIKTLYSDLSSGLKNFDDSIINLQKLYKLVEQAILHKIKSFEDKYKILYKEPTEKSLVASPFAIKPMKKKKSVNNEFASDETIEALNKNITTYKKNIKFNSDKLLNLLKDLAGKLEYIKQAEDQTEEIWLEILDAME